MIPSFGEVQATALKAARGAGLPWGICEDAGAAVRWLWERGYDGPGALAALLQGYQPVSCPLRLAASLADGTSSLPMRATVRSAVLLLPTAAELGAEVTNTSDDFAETQVLVVASEKDWVPPIGPRREIEQAAWRVLKRFESRTYAPPTEASRAGAGAGLTDND